MPAKVKPVGNLEDFSSRILPMNAQVAEQAFNDPDWTFEPKLDGYRLTAYINDDEVRLLTRGGHDYSSYFPHIVQDLTARALPPMVIDVEVVEFEDGRPSFEALQGHVNKRAARLRKDPAQVRAVLLRHSPPCRHEHARATLYRAPAAAA